jgi:hypothetical protein
VDIEVENEEIINDVGSVKVNVGEGAREQPFRSLTTQV